MRRNTEGCRDIPADVGLYYAAFNLQGSMKKNFHLLKIVYYKKYMFTVGTCKPTLLDNLGVSQLQTIS